MTGRDVEDSSYQAAFTGNGWQTATPTFFISTQSATRQAIYAWLEKHGPATPAAIAIWTQLDSDIIRHRVIIMASEGTLERPSFGKYSVPGEE